MSSKGLIRSRWAAIGAAVAVTLGGGGLIGVSAASGDASSLKTVTPTRIMDTRQGTDGKVSGKTVALQVTGEVTTYASDGTTPAATVVPAGANAVSLNLTVTQGERNQGYGFVTAFPCTAVTDTVPNASTLNFVEGVDVANSTVVPLGSTGKICLNVYGSAHLIIDANGYYETTESVDAYTKAESDATEADINAAIDLKADVGASYTKAESDALNLIAEQRQVEINYGVTSPTYGVGTGTCTWSSSGGGGNLSVNTSGILQGSYDNSGLNWEKCTRLGYTLTVPQYYVDASGELAIATHESQLRSVYLCVGQHTDAIENASVDSVVVYNGDGIVYRWDIDLEGSPTGSSPRCSFMNIDDATTDNSADALVTQGPFYLELRLGANSSDAGDFEIAKLTAVWEIVEF